jgi:hypothetical protein
MYYRTRAVSAHEAPKENCRPGSAASLAAQLMIDDLSPGEFSIRYDFRGDVQERE